MEAALGDEAGARDGTGRRGEEDSGCHFMCVCVCTWMDGRMLLYRSVGVKWTLVSCAEQIVQARGG